MIVTDITGYKGSPVLEEVASKGCSKVTSQDSILYLESVSAGIHSHCYSERYFMVFSVLVTGKYHSVC